MKIIIIKQFKSSKENVYLKLKLFGQLTCESTSLAKWHSILECKLYYSGPQKRTDL